jgi:tRNA threonylcarbamoyladenosine biosynthesis protein TsaE
MERHTLNSPKETAKIAAALAKRMRGGEVVALYGDLGAGKTTFAQAFAKALGVKERVQSPTFILMHEHRLKKKNGPAYFLHADAYRADAAQFRAVGFEEYLGRPDAVVLVEWAERVEALLPKKRVEVRLKHLGGDRRRLTLKG